MNIKNSNMGVGNSGVALRKLIATGSGFGVLRSNDVRAHGTGVCNAICTCRNGVNNFAVSSKQLC